VPLKHYNCAKHAVTTTKSSHASLKVQLPNVCFVIQNRLIVKSFQKTFPHFQLFLVAREWHQNLWGSWIWQQKLWGFNRMVPKAV